ncbi:hypothetical protein [Streptomyces sp. CB02959]|uniref:hypothetical protein n=1 Tax=Streptomyces sp. CB02959 TaxID=2020330 RepID=UPI0015E074BC|nr:hypothetical protein [Streptomyces sp. CB02959]
MTRQPPRRPWPHAAARPKPPLIKAARSNLRFQDRRVADLEARIAEPAPKS